MRFPAIFVIGWVVSAGMTKAPAGEPVVRMLVPGFTVRELPVELSNINNLRFDLEGRLTALGYDGRIHRLRDTDGDGIEDRADVFWDGPTLSVPVGMAWAREGVYVSSKGKVSLIRDTDGDGKGDVEEVIASGWPPTDVASGGVDATAVTLDSEGNVYFGLLVADYSNAYRLRDGIPHYDRNSRRGTIQKWSRATGKLETLATCIRVPYALNFNRHGDLFVTDQEGETWLPGGNPLDELNHIIAGRHYGFPPRHEKWLPDVIDEPPVVAFGPQHQSACGFVFNEPGLRRKRFGPAWWEGDALVAGESRGKIWRVRLVKTPAGYVGKEYLIARLSMLTTDLAISPEGALYVSCHSGEPDWGTGPRGPGKLFKITYEGGRVAQPVAVWPAGPMQVRVVFDRPLDPSVATNALKGIIEFGEFVSAADRFETLKPPYQTVKDQDTAPRGRLRIIGAALRNSIVLVLSTDPHPVAGRYALTLPGVRARGGEEATIDLAYDLTGVHLAGGRWLPHIDVAVARSVLGGVPGPFWSDLRVLREDPFSAGGAREWRVETGIALPPGEYTFGLEADQSFAVRLGSASSRSAPQRSGGHRAEVNAVVADGKRLGFSLSVPLTSRAWSQYPTNIPRVRLAYWSRANPTPRPLRLEQLWVPWAPEGSPSPLRPPKVELAGGDYQRGKDLFFGEQIKCGSCHRVRGEGAVTGPDLSNLTYRDAASVWRDIIEPSATLHPDYIAYHIQLENGEERTGFVRAHDSESIRLTAADGKEEPIHRIDIKGLRVSEVSLMPAGLAEGASEAQRQDLLTFLLHAPPVRTAVELEAVFGKPTPAPVPVPEAARPVKLVLVASAQDHGPGEHDYPAWQRKWLELLDQLPQVTAEAATNWPAAEQFRAADGIVFYYWNHDWNAERLAQLDEFLARGGGVVVLHSATIADRDPEQLAGRIGLAAQPGRTKYLHCPFDLKLVAPTNHPITRGLPSLIRFLDEPYWPMIGDTNQVEVLATARQDASDWPLLWTFQKGPGRVFGSILGHYTWTFDDPMFRALWLRGTAWAIREAPERFAELIAK